jgi:hypothetical protein
VRYFHSLWWTQEATLNVPNSYGTFNNFSSKFSWISCTFNFLLSLLILPLFLKSRVLTLCLQMNFLLSLGKMRRLVPRKIHLWKSRLAEGGTHGNLALVGTTKRQSRRIEVLWGWPSADLRRPHGILGVCGG